MMRGGRAGCESSQGKCTAQSPQERLRVNVVNDHFESPQLHTPEGLYRTSKLENRSISPTTFSKVSRKQTSPPSLSSDSPCPAPQELFDKGNRLSSEGQTCSLPFCALTLTLPPPSLSLSLSLPSLDHITVSPTKACLGFEIVKQRLSMDR